MRGWLGDAGLRPGAARLGHAVRRRDCGGDQSMKVTEPMTMVTDYALGALAFVLALRDCMRRRAASGQLSIRLWAFGFVMTAVAAFVGGTYHGFIQMMPGRGRARLLEDHAASPPGSGSACLLGAAVMAATTGTLEWPCSASSSSSCSSSSKS